MALAKDVARLTADRIDISSLRKIIAPPKGENWGSLKSLEKAVGTVLSEEQARATVTPLVGVYELRLGDAHLPTSKIDDAFGMVGIDPAAGFIEQGHQLLIGVVRSLHAVEKALAPSAGRARRGIVRTQHD